jgi:hypothetical protein
MPRSAWSARTRTFSPTGPAKPHRRAGDPLDRRRIGHRHNRRAERADQLGLAHRVVAAHQRRHRLAAIRRHEQRLDEAIGGHAEESADFFNRPLIRRRDLLHRLQRAGMHRRRHLRDGRLLDVGRVAAARTAHERVLTRLGQHVELVRHAAADRAGGRLDRAELQPAAGEDARVGFGHHVVLALAVGVVDVERVRILHDELAPAHQAEARPHFIAELRLDLVQVQWQVAVRAHLAAHDVGDHLLVRRAVAELAIAAVADAQQLLAVVIPPAGLLPQLRRADGRHQDLLRAGAVHLLAHDPLDLADDAQAERQEVVDAARHLPQHAGAHHQLVTDHFGVGGVFLQRRNQRTRVAHAIRRTVATPSARWESERRLGASFGARVSRPAAARRAAQRGGSALRGGSAAPAGLEARAPKDALIPETVLSKMLMPQTKHTFCRICEALCGLEVDVENNTIVDIRPDKAHVATEGFGCMKGLKQHKLFGSPDRVLHPMKRVGRAGSASRGRRH